MSGTERGLVDSDTMGGYPSSNLKRPLASETSATFPQEVHSQRLDGGDSTFVTSSRSQDLRAPELVRAFSVAVKLPDLPEEFGDNPVPNDIPANLRVEILCDDDGIILHADDNIAALLLYSPSVLVGEFIGTLTAPFAPREPHQKKLIR